MQTYDVFISHASEDKESVARPIARELESRGYSVWIDEQELKLGDQLRQKINEGLTSSRFGVVILSKHFFAKSWTKEELDALMNRQATSGKIVLPVRHEITSAQVSSFHATLGNQLSASFKRGVGHVCTEIERVLNDKEAAVFPNPTKSFSDNDGGAVATDVELSDIELTLNRDFEEFSARDQAQVLEAIGKLIGMRGSEIRIKNKRQGSVKLTLELTPAQAERLLWAVKGGALAEMDVVDAELIEVATAMNQGTGLRDSRRSRAEADQLADFVLHSIHSCLLDLSHELNQGFISFPQFFLLVSFANEDYLTISDIANKMGHSTAAASGLVDRLEKLGYVERIRSVEKRRKIMVRITHKSTELVAHIRNQIAKSIIQQENPVCALRFLLHSGEADQVADFVLHSIRNCLPNLSKDLNRGNISLPQFFLLVSLASEDYLTISDIANKMGHSTAAASGLVDRLEKLGYVERIHSVEKRRKIMVRITHKSTELVAHIRNQIASNLMQDT